MRRTLVLFGAALSSAAFLLLAGSAGGVLAQEPPSERRAVPPAMLLSMPLEEGQAVVFHLFHSGFVVRTAHRVLVFDPWDGPTEPEGRGLAHGTLEPEELAGHEVWVFVTHEHDDHWDRDALAWREVLPGIRYVVSPEVAAASDDWAGNEAVTVPGHRDAADLDGLAVETFPARDSGVAYRIEVDGLVLYHSGDHATWNWEDDPGNEAAFVDELRPWLADRDLDLAFHVCDPRLADADWGGPVGFAEAFGPRVLVAMHAKGDYAGLARFAELHRDDIDAVLWTPGHRGDTFVWRGAP